MQLTTDPTPDWCTAWSPDGEQIAFQAYALRRPGHQGDARRRWPGAATDI